MRGSRYRPCGLAVCPGHTHLLAHDPKTVPVWSVDGQHMLMWAEPQHVWGIAVGTALERLELSQDLFGWDDPEGMAAYGQWVRDPEVFAALVGIEIE